MRNNGKGVAVDDAGTGLKLCSIFSKSFTVETTCEESGMLFKQVQYITIITN